MGCLPAGGKGLVLLTGGSGFIASHILDALLDDGFKVVVTARSETKGQRILDGLGPMTRHMASIAVVRDIVQPGAFDEVLGSNEFDFVVHTASPYHFNIQNPVKDFLDPAIQGTLGLLRSIRGHCPSVKRLVMTSSSAAVLDPDSDTKVYDESCWYSVTWEEAMDPAKTYKASKVFAERAAWDFVADEKPNFDLAVINNTYTFGPVQRRLASLDEMNTSNHRIRDMMQGKMKRGLDPTFPVFTFVDVRDVALAHLRAMTLPEAGGRRFYIVAQHFSNKLIADIIRGALPELGARVLPPEAEVVDDLPGDVYRFDNGRSREVLGLQYTSLEKSVLDTVESILTLQAGTS